MMKQLKSINNQDILDQLKKYPNQGILFEIIETGVTGTILELSKDVLIIRENCNDPFVFVAGELTAKNVLQITELLKDYKFPMVHCDKRFHPLFLEKGWNFHVRILLKFSGNIDSHDNTLSISKVNSTEIFKQCTWYNERKELYGSDDNFVNNGTGYALFVNDTLVSEAYASIGANIAEIGVVTADKYRGKGYATQVVSFMISELAKRNIYPEWSCNIDNTASLKTGLKLGFEIADYYTLLVPNCGNVLCPNLVKWLENNTYP